MKAAVNQQASMVANLSVQNIDDKHPINKKLYWLHYFLSTTTKQEENADFPKRLIAEEKGV